MSPELKDALLARRNANWARWVKGRLDQPGTVLVAVGAGHLAGDQSVVEHAEKAGRESHTRPVIARLIAQFVANMRSLR